MLTIVTLLGGNASNFYAADYTYANWTTIRINPATGASATWVNLYVTTTEQYEWAVTDYADPSGGGSVALTGSNVSISMANGANNTLNKVNAKTFTIYNIRVTESNPYAQFNITMTYDSYITRFNGYVKIL